MKLSTIIAKAEDSLAKLGRKAAVRTKNLVSEVRVEVRASRLARGAAEAMRAEALLDRPIETVHASQQAVEAAEIIVRAKEIEAAREAAELAKDEARRRREYIRKIQSGEIQIP